MMEGRKPERPGKPLNNELQKMPQTKAWKFKPQPRLEPAHQHWWQARKSHVLTIPPDCSDHVICNTLSPTSIVPSQHFSHWKTMSKLMWRFLQFKYIFTVRSSWWHTHTHDTLAGFVQMSQQQTTHLVEIVGWSGASGSSVQRTWTLCKTEGCPLCSVLPPGICERTPCLRCLHF